MSEPLEEKSAGPSPSGVLLVLLLVVAGTTTRWGSFSWEGLVLMLGAACLAILLHLRPHLVKIAPESLLVGMLISFIAVTCCLRSGLNETAVRYALPNISDPLQRLNGFGIAIKILAAMALMVALTYLPDTETRVRSLAKYRVAVLVLVAVAIRVMILLSSPEPKIDVFHVQTEGAQGLFEGQNIYSMKFKAPPIEQGQAAEYYGYQYPPTAFYPIVLAWALFKDVRAAWVICDLLTALLLHLLARRMRPRAELGRFCELLVLTFLFLPRTLFVLESAWMEPLIVVALAAFALALAHGRGPVLTGCTMAIWLSSKQYLALALPFLLKLRRAGLVAWVWAAATGVALALPFVIWDWRSLMGKVVLFIFKSPGRADALSIFGALYRNGVEMPGWVGLLLWASAMVWFAWKMPRNLSGWLFSTASMWLIFFLVGKWAFMNYFHLVACTLLLAVAASEAREEPST